MESREIESDKAQIVVSLDELRFLCNAINEVCHGIDLPEFETRLSVSPEFAESLMQSLEKVLQDMKNAT